MPGANIPGEVLTHCLKQPWEGPSSQYLAGQAYGSPGVIGTDHLVARKDLLGRLFVPRPSTATLKEQRQDCLKLGRSEPCQEAPSTTATNLQASPSLHEAEGPCQPEPNSLPVLHALPEGQRAHSSELPPLPLAVQKKSHLPRKPAQLIPPMDPHRPMGPQGVPQHPLRSHVKSRLRRRQAPILNPSPQAPLPICFKNLLTPKRGSKQSKLKQGGA